MLIFKWWRINYISLLGTKILPSASPRAIFRPAGANIVNAALNPSQYLYNILTNTIYITGTFQRWPTYISQIESLKFSTDTYFFYLKPIWCSVQVWSASALSAHLSNIIMTTSYCKVRTVFYVNKFRWILQEKHITIVRN